MTHLCPGHAQVHAMIMQTATPRKWDCKEFQDIQRDDRVKDLLAQAIKTTTLDLDEVALRARARLCEVKHGRRRSSYRRSTRRTSSAPGQIDLGKLATLAATAPGVVSGQRRRNRNSPGGMAHPFDVNREPDRGLLHRSSMHRRTRTSFGDTNRFGSFGSTNMTPVLEES